MWLSELGVDSGIVLHERKVTPQAHLCKSKLVFVVACDLEIRRPISSEHRLNFPSGACLLIS